MTNKNVDKAIQILTDETERRGGTSNDDDGTVRRVVMSHELGFNAWFCVCCELADRDARREGFKNSIDRAATLAFAAMKKNNEEVMR